jgi:hypothetical protein
MIKQVMANARVPEQTMLNYFQKLFIGSLYAICNSDEEFLKEYLEINMVNKILESNNKLKENNLFLKVDSDLGDTNEQIPTFCEIIDGLVIKGITSDREQNGDISQYHTWSDLDDMGITVYTEKKYSNPENFVDPKQNQSMYDDYEKVMVRLLISIKTPYVLNIVKKDVSNEKATYYKEENGENDEQEEWSAHDHDPSGSEKSSKIKLNKRTIQSRVRKERKTIQKY